MRNKPDGSVVSVTADASALIQQSSNFRLLLTDPAHWRLPVNTAVIAVENSMLMQSTGRGENLVGDICIDRHLTYDLRPNHRPCQVECGWAAAMHVLAIEDLGILKPY